MKLLNFLIIKITICLVTGILIGYYFAVSWKLLLGILFIGLLLFGIAYFLAIDKPKQRICFALITYGITITAGVLLITFHTHKNQIQHYSTKLQEAGSKDIKIRIYKQLKPNSFYNKFLAKVSSVNSENVSGILLVNVDTTSTLKIDDVLYLNTELKKLKNR